MVCSSVTFYFFMDREEVCVVGTSGAGVGQVVGTLQQGNRSKCSSSAEQLPALLYLPVLQQ
jgi:hypothetical protein